MGKYALACIEALKLSIRLQLQTPSVDYEICAQTFRRLISLTKETEHSFPYFEEIFKIIQGLENNSFPIIELQWFLISAWNNGVYFYRMMNFKDAEKWMGIAINLLRRYPKKEDYESEMMSSYAEILSKTTSSKDN